LRQVERNHKRAHTFVERHLLKKHESPSPERSIHFESVLFEEDYDKEAETKPFQANEELSDGKS
jgi:hypothetical protein